jgi:AcrR family transcriptional regulator
MESQYNDKQLHLMEVALRLFADQGFTKTSVRNIADEAGVNLAMISYYFGSKQELLEAIFDQHLSEKTSKIDAIIANDKLEPFQMIERFVDFFVTSFYKSRQFNKIMIRETTKEVDKDSVIFAKVVKSRMENRKTIESVIRKGQMTGLFRKDIDVIMLACVMIGAINQVISNTPYYSLVYNIPEDNEELYQQKVVKKLSKELKIMLKAYLTNDTEK